MSGDAQDVAAQKVKQLIVLVDKMEIQQGALENKLRQTEVRWSQPGPRGLDIPGL